MGILSALFGTKDSIREIFDETERNIFQICKAVRPTNSEKIKSAVYLCVSGIALIERFSPKTDRGKEIDREFFNRIIAEARDSISDINVKLFDLAENDKDKKIILSHCKLSVNTSNNVNLSGNDAFNALFFDKAQYFVQPIVQYDIRPAGPAGYAAKLYAQEVFGSDMYLTDMYLAEITNEIIQFSKKLINFSIIGR